MALKRGVILALILVLCGLEITHSAEEGEGVIGSAQQALSEGKTGEALSHLLTAIQDQQNSLRALELRATEQEDTIREQQESLEVLSRRLSEQEEVIAEQRKIISEHKTAIEEQKVSAAGMVAFKDIQKAETLYDRAKDLRYVGIFEVRGRDKEPYFRKAIEKFRQVAEKYPQSLRAPDALYQIGGLYRRWLRDTTQAGPAYREVITKYPDSEWADEAREALQEMGSSAK